LLNNKNCLSKASKHKVLLIGDRHLRGYSENMKLHLNDQLQVSGYIKPGAGTKIILEQATKDVDNLLAKDFIILSCGSNDIGRVQLSMVFNDVINFIKRVMHTNVILLTVPYRHDLKGPNIIFNDEIRNVNRKLLKLKKLFHILVWWK
jgi:hypothetical protein